MMYNYAMDQGQYAQQNGGNYGVNPMTSFQGPMYPTNFQQMNQMQQQMNHQQLPQMQWNNQMTAYYSNYHSYTAPTPQFAPMVAMAPNYQHPAPAPNQWNFQNHMPFNNVPNFQAPMAPQIPMHLQGPSAGPAQIPPNAYNFIQPDAPAVQAFSNIRQSSQVVQSVSDPVRLAHNSVDSINTQTPQVQEASNYIKSDIPVVPSSNTSSVPASSSASSLPPSDQIQDQQDDEFQYDLDQEEFDPFKFEELLQQEDDEIAPQDTSSASAPAAASSSDSSDALVDPVLEVQEDNESDSKGDVEFKYHLDQNEFDLDQWEKFMEDDDIVEELPSISADMTPSSPSSDDKSSLSSLPSILGSCEKNPITLDEDSVPVTKGSDDVVLLEDDIEVIPIPVQSPAQHQIDHIQWDALIEYNVMISESQDVPSTSYASSCPSNSRYSPYARPCTQVKAPCKVPLISGKPEEPAMTVQKKKKTSRPRAQRKPRAPKSHGSSSTN